MYTKYYFKTPIEKFLLYSKNKWNMKLSLNDLIYNFSTPLERQINENKYKYYD